MPLRLPTSSSPVVAAVMEYTQAHLADVDERAVCAAVGLSERSLRRQFRAETGTSWQDYRTTSRVMRAMALLAAREHTVLDAASAVGFDSLSGFDRAFLRLTGERPREYRRRVQT